MNDSDTDSCSRTFVALRESAELYRATLMSSSDAMFLTDDDGAFTFVCPNADVIFGYRPDEIRAMGRIDSLLGDGLFDRERLSRCGEIHNIEREVAAKSGAVRSLLIHVKRVAIETGTVLYCCRDVTDLRRAEHELRELRTELTHAARLALCGQLTAAIAHEVRQPLTAIFANATAGARSLERDAVDTRLLRDIFADIEDAARFAADAMERLRALAAKRPLALHPLNLNELAEDTLHILRGDARRRHVALRTELASSLPAVRADRVCLQQVLLNLALNAMEAMEAFGASSREILVQTRRMGELVEVTVSDTGPGIPIEHLPKLFDAFFTTKEDGLGLGLTVSQAIVASHAGRIWGETTGGRGATFHVALPAN